MSRTGPLYAAMGWMAVVAVVGGSACQPEEETPDSVGVLDAAVLESISPTRLRADVDVLAADAMGGRSPGSYGHSLARDYVLAEMEAAGLQPLRLDETYVQTYANSPSVE